MLADDRRSTAPQSVTRVIRILEALSAASGPLSLAELSRALQTPKSSLSALLRGLVDDELVLASEGLYRLGPGAFCLGAALMEARRRLQSSELIREGMRRLAERSGETVLFAVPDADGETLTYIEVIESRNAVRFAVSVGDRRPLYCTAGGRALLAAAPEAHVEGYLRRLRPQARAGGTETDKRKLAHALAAARAQGVAQTIDEAADGVTGTGAVIHDASGAVIGALIVAAPSLRLQERLTELADLVREEARGISRSLGHRAPREAAA